MNFDAANNPKFQRIKALIAVGHRATDGKTRSFAESFSSVGEMLGFKLRDEDEQHKLDALTHYEETGETTFNYLKYNPLKGVSEKTSITLDFDKIKDTIEKGAHEESKASEASLGILGKIGNLAYHTLGKAVDTFFLDKNLGKINLVGSAIKTGLTLGAAMYMPLLMGSATAVLGPAFPLVATGAFGLLTAGFVIGGLSKMWNNQNKHTNEFYDGFAETALGALGGLGIWGEVGRASNVLKNGMQQSQVLLEAMAGKSSNYYVGRVAQRLQSLLFGNHPIATRAQVREFVALEYRMANLAPGKGISGKTVETLTNRHSTEDALYNGIKHADPEFKGDGSFDPKHLKDQFINPHTEHVADRAEANLLSPEFQTEIDILQQLKADPSIISGAHTPFYRSAVHKNVASVDSANHYNVIGAERTGGNTFTIKVRHQGTTHTTLLAPKEATLETSIVAHVDPRTGKVSKFKYQNPTAIEQSKLINTPDILFAEQSGGHSIASLGAEQIAHRYSINPNEFHWAFQGGTKTGNKLIFDVIATGKQSKETGYFRVVFDPTAKTQYTLTPLTEISEVGALNPSGKVQFLEKIGPLQEKINTQLVSEANHNLAHFNTLKASSKINLKGQESSISAINPKRNSGANVASTANTPFVLIKGSSTHEGNSAKQEENNSNAKYEDRNKASYGGNYSLGLSMSGGLSGSQATMPIGFGLSGSY